jgi:hypothetical protein
MLISPNQKQYGGGFHPPDAPRKNNAPVGLLIDGIRINSSMIQTTAKEIKNGINWIRAVAIQALSMRDRHVAGHTNASIFSSDPKYGE